MAKRQKKTPKREPKWKMVERVVSLIEQAIDPGATVEHNVNLPDLATPGHARQCDVVVTTGPKHRRTRTIVEVQRRGKKVEVAHFDSWVAKMRAVGAQHLVCVSATGYPQSVKDKSAQLGPSVRLVTLKDLQAGHPLLQAAFGQLRVHSCETTTFSDIEVLVNGRTHIGTSQNELCYEERVFRTKEGCTLSLNEIAQRLLSVRQAHLSSGKHKIPFRTADSFAFLLNESVGPVRLSFVATVAAQEVAVACDLLEYRQLDENGVLAWVLVGEATLNSGRACEFKVTFRPGADGRLVPHAINVTGLKSGDILSAKAARSMLGPLVIKTAAD
jgi:hypothetical protein